MTSIMNSTILVLPLIIVVVLLLFLILVLPLVIVLPLIVGALVEALRFPLVPAPPPHLVEALPLPVPVLVILLALVPSNVKRVLV